jgi:Domain of unknown function (DUF4136)
MWSRCIGRNFEGVLVMWKWVLGSLVLVLGGCASINTVHSEVSTYSQWPSGRAPGSYRFERLPSQQAQAGEQAHFEALARQGIEAAGFRPEPDPAKADVGIEVAMRSSRVDAYPHDGPYGWRSGFYAARPWGPRYGRYPHHYVGGGVYFDAPRFVRETVVLVRDRATQQVLYEAHASSEGNSPGSDLIVGAMFKASMVDFPRQGVNPRPVVVTVVPAAAAASAPSAAPGR